MSMHLKPTTPSEEAGLRAHGLPVGEPSQLADAFRLGMAWTQKEAPVNMRLLIALRSCVDAMDRIRAQYGVDTAAEIEARAVIAAAEARQVGPVLISDRELWELRNYVATEVVTRDDTSEEICIKHGRAVESAVLCANGLPPGD